MHTHTHTQQTGGHMTYMTPLQPKVKTSVFPSCRNKFKVRKRKQQQ